MNWLDLVHAEVAASSIAATAGRMGVSRSALSQVINGCGPYGTGRASVASIARAAVENLGTVTCPFLTEFHGQPTQVRLSECREIASRRTPPTNSPRALAHWRACRECPHCSTIVMEKAV